MLSDQVNAVPDGEEELLDPGVCLHHVVEVCHCSAIIIFRIEDPAVPQCVIGKYQAAVSQNPHRLLVVGTVVLFVGIHEDEVSLSIRQALQDIERLTHPESDLEAAGTPVEEALGDLCMLGIMLDSDNFTILRDGFGHYESRVAGKGSHINDVLCA